MMRLLGWKRDRARLHSLGEEECYGRSYGDRSSLVRTVKLEPRRPRYQLRVSGEDLRRRFQERLERREAEEAEELFGDAEADEERHAAPPSA